MRFYLVSFFLHFSVLLMGFFFSQTPTRLNPSQKNTVIVEMISLPEINTPKSSPLKIQKKAQPIAKKPSPKKTFTTKKQKDESKLKEEVTSEASRSASLTYAQELKLFLEKNKHYPRQAIRLKQSGVVIVRVRITTRGGFKNVEVTGPSSFPILNQAAINLLNKLGKFKPLPKKLKGDTQFTIPVSYVMGDS